MNADILLVQFFALFNNASFVPLVADASRGLSRDELSKQRQPPPFNHRRPAAHMPTSTRPVSKSPMHRNLCMRPPSTSTPSTTLPIRRSSPRRSGSTFARGHELVISRGEMRRPLVLGRKSLICMTQWRCVLIPKCVRSLSCLVMTEKKIFQRKGIEFQQQQKVLWFELKLTMKILTHDGVNTIWHQTPWVRLLLATCTACTAEYNFFCAKRPILLLRHCVDCPVWTSELVGKAWSMRHIV